MKVLVNKMWFLALRTRKMVMQVIHRSNRSEILAVFIQSRWRRNVGITQDKDHNITSIYEAV